MKCTVIMISVLAGGLSTASAQAPKGWFVAGSHPREYKASIDRETVRSGEASAHFESAVLKTGGFGTLMQQFKASEFRGKRVRLSGYVRAQEVNDWAGLWMRVDGAGGETLGFDNMQGRPIKGTKDWTKYEIVLDVPEKAEEIAYGLLLTGRGDTWLDDLRFEVVGKGTPVTGQSSGKKLPVEPVNLDFEQNSRLNKPEPTAPREYFATTRWTVVLAAGRRSTPDAAEALEELCKTYWYPLYAYVRRHGHSRQDAEDLTQGFFARLLEKNDLEGLDSEKGKFRAFLLAALKHFLANEWDRANRQKRGGTATVLSLDWRHAETRYQIEPADELSPDKLYDRTWAVALLERVITRLRDESIAEGKSSLFEQLRPFLMIGKSAIPYAQAAAALGLSEGAVRVVVHRLRHRYRELLREEISQTLSDPGQVEEEMQALFTAFA